MGARTFVIGIAGFWLGCLVAIDLIETPAKFRTDGLSRAAAVELGRIVFRRLGYLEVVLGAALTLAALRIGGPSVGIAALLWGLALLLTAVVRPRLDRFVPQPDSSPAPGDRNQTARRMLHRLYIAGDGLKMLLMLILMAMLGGA